MKVVFYLAITAALIVSIAFPRGSRLKIKLLLGLSAVALLSASISSPDLAGISVIGFLLLGILALLLLKGN
jgi:hypothetical protein